MTLHHHLHHIFDLNVAEKKPHIDAIRKMTPAGMSTADFILSGNRTGRNNQDWKEDLTEFAREVLKSDWRGEGMRDPDVAMTYVRTQCLEQSDFDDLFPEAQKFWLAVRSKFMAWKAKDMTDAQLLAS